MMTGPERDVLRLIANGDLNDDDRSAYPEHVIALIDDLDEKDDEIQRLNDRMAQMIREHQGQYTFTRDIKDFVVTELCRALQEIEGGRDSKAHDRLKKARETIESVQPGISKLSEARSRADLSNDKGATND